MDGPTDGQTDGRTDKATYRVAWMHLKNWVSPQCGHAQCAFLDNLIYSEMKFAQNTLLQTFMISMTKKNGTHDSKNKIPS